jgi:flavin reductase (DIM6/NTAB) family NADH-FMN oxidoreductase RutF
VVDIGFRSAMQQLTGHVTVLTTSDQPGTRAGLTATAVCSLTAEPPELIVCINRMSGFAELVHRTGKFCVNLLSAYQQDVAETFAGLTFLAGGHRFHTGSWDLPPGGCPALRGALAQLQCQVAESIPRSTHDLIIGRVLAVTTTENGPGPLLYRGRRFAEFPGGPDTAARTARPLLRERWPSSGRWA